MILVTAVLALVGAHTVQALVPTAVHHPCRARHRSSGVLYGARASIVTAVRQRQDGQSAVGRSLNLRPNKKEMQQ